LPRASSLAAAIREASGLDSRLIKGDNGIFDVIADGEMLFSKHEAGRFPEHDEILERLPASG
jgi:predicted Rdx family selenoprotein